MRDPYQDDEYSRDTYESEDQRLERSDRKLKWAFGIYIGLIIIGILLDSMGFYLLITGGFFIYMIFNLGGRFKR